MNVGLLPWAPKTSQAISSPTIVPPWLIPKPNAMFSSEVLVVSNALPQVMGPPGTPMLVLNSPLSIW